MREGGSRAKYKPKVEKHGKGKRQERDNSAKGKN
jgi:hypothetical protein